LSAYKESLQSFATTNFFQDVVHYHDTILNKLNLQTLHIRRRHFDALFLRNIFTGTKYWPIDLETVGIRVPARNTRNSPRSVAPSATALQLDVFLLQMQFVNVQIFLITHA
jgi:hypothetical protein